MKKIFLSIALIGIITINLLGCGKSEEEKRMEEAAAATAEAYEEYMKSVKSFGGMYEESEEVEKTKESKNSKKDVDGKGSRKNPYKLGDTITVTGIPIFDSKGTEPLEITFVLNEHYDEKEAPQFLAETFNLGHNGPYQVFAYSVELVGDIDSMHYDDYYFTQAVSEDMEIITGMVKDSQYNGATQLFTGNEYELYYTAVYNNENTNLKYLILKYNDINNELQQIYIEL